MLFRSGVARDITRQKQAEEAKQALETQLLQAQKLEAIGTLTGGIAHDFNNSLQGILGYTQILMMDLPRGSPLAERLGRIESSALKASELTRQLLTFSRRVESRLRPLDLNQAIRQIEGMARRTIPRMIRIELELDEELRIINADAAQLEQVVMNLMINSRDAMPEGGTLKIGTRNETLDANGCPLHPEAPPGEYVAMSVSDNGLGMHPRTLEHIFEPFYTTKEPGKGTGLGLSMVYGVVKNHGGHIACRSEPGRGARFHILLPALKEEPAPVAEERPSEARRAGSETILLVDDEAGIREQASEILTRFGYRVLHAEDGRRALDIYREKKDSISLVVLDVIMPGMGGPECLDEILRIDPGQRVIVVSGDAFSGPLLEVLETCGGGSLKKPYALDQLLAKVRTVLDG